MDRRGSVSPADYPQQRKGNSSFMTAFVLLVVICIFSTVSFAPNPSKARSIHGSYIEAYDTISRRRLRPVEIDVAHKEGLAHWATWVILIDFKRELILLQKSKKERETCPGAWGVSGEHLEANETTGDTAVRGLREELGIHAKRDELHVLDNFLLRHKYESGRMDVQNSTVFVYPLDTAAAGVDAQSHAWPHNLDDESEKVQLVPISVFRRWCEHEPERLCGKTFAHAYLKYLLAICKKQAELPFVSAHFCAEYHPLNRRKRLPDAPH
eukprot:Rhum_TRINITY_DN11089_c0_g2::Rhum_TRINITY_DN11089_c0_g2_i1::g.42316::m.42316